MNYEECIGLAGPWQMVVSRCGETDLCNTVHMGPTSGNLTPPLVTTGQELAGIKVKSNKNCLPSCLSNVSQFSDRSV